MLWDEVKLHEERSNRMLVSLAVIVQAATATTGMTASKDAVEHFRKVINELSGE